MLSLLQSVCECVCNTQPALLLTQLQQEKCLGESCSHPGWGKRSGIFCPSLTLPAGEGNRVWFELLALNTFAKACAREVEESGHVRDLQLLTLLLAGFQVLACVCSSEPLNRGFFMGQNCFNVFPREIPLTTLV